MNIGIDGRLWNETGVGRYIRNLVYNLAQIDKKNEYVLFVSKGFQIKDLRLKNNWKVVEVDIRWHTIEEQLKFPQILNKENLDLVHFPYFSIPINYKKPFVITIHDLIINHFPTGKASTLPTPLYQLKRFGYNYVVSHAIKNAKKIIVPLNAVKNDVINSYLVKNEKIAVTYEGFDNKIIAQKSKDVDGKYFLYVGNAYPHKNIERLLKAFIKFKSEDVGGIELKLVGKDDYFYKKLQERIDRESLKDISINNNVNDEELGNLYKNALCLIAPSLMEGFGLPVLESMNMSCLVLASDIPSFREVCRDAAIYFDPYSVKDIEDKLKFVNDLNYLEKKRYIEKGLARARDFSWEKMAKETIKVYESSAGI